MRAQWIYFERSWRGHSHCVFGWQEKTLPQRRDRRRNHSLGDVFIVDIGNVENAQPAFAHRGVEILSTRLQVKNLRARMMVRFFQRTMILDVLLVVVGISDLLKVAADHGGR